MRKHLLLCVAAFSTQLTYAHHSNAPHFDTDVEVTNTGVVTEWKLVNPHAFIYFEVTNDDGTTSRWRCETDAASSLRQRGYTEETFVVGETITVTGNPARREDNHCFFRDFVFADGTAVGRNTNIASLDRGSDSAVDQVAVEDIEALLFADEPNISGYWTDSAQLTVANETPQGPGGGGGMGGMGIVPDGSLPPRLARIAGIGLTPAGQEAQDKYERIYDDPALHCRISNIVDALGRDDTVNMIQQKGDIIEFRYGYMDYLRTIHLNLEAHPEDIEPTPGGHSIGRWEGNTLIVDTIGFTPSVLNAQVGMPTSEGFHVVERITYNEDDDALEREYVANDSEYWTASHTGSDSLGRSSAPYTPYNCETLSGLNNLRPGTPEYEAEVARLAAVNAAASAEPTSDTTQTDAQSENRRLMLPVLLFIALMVLVAGFVLGKRKQ